MINNIDWSQFYNNVYTSICEQLRSDNPNEDDIKRCINRQCISFIEKINTRLKEKYNIAIYKSVLYVNSIFLKEKRIASYYPNKRKSWNKTDKAFTRFNFELDVKAHHILPETIWKLRDSDEQNRNICPLIFWDKDLPNLEYPYKIDVSQLKSTFSLELKKHIKALSARSHDDFNSQKLWDILFQEEDIRESVESIAKQLSKYRQNEQDYSEEEAKRLFSHIVWHINAKNNKYKNIFYIPDIVPSSATGGMVCVFDLTQLSKNVSLVDVIRELQRFLGFYCLSPIKTAVYDCCSIFVRLSGDYFCYRSTKYFQKEEVCDDFIIEVTRTIDSDCPLMKFTTSTLIELFKELTVDKLSSVIRGYKRISQRVFVCVCTLWNELNFERSFKKIKQDNLGQLKRDIQLFREAEKQLNNKGKHTSLLLLYEALNFEDSLKEVPSYRDHFLHSFHSFCLGLWIASQDFVPETIKNIRRNPELLKEWFYAAFWHDIGYSIEKVEDLTNKYVRKMLYHKVDDKEAVLPISPRWGDFCLLDSFYDIFNKNTVKDKLDKIVDSEERNQTKEILKTMLKYADHGILSGLLLYRHFELNNTNSDKVLNPIIAMMLHHCGEKKWKKTKFYNCKFAHEHPILHLIKLTDILSQFGRDFEVQEKKMIILLGKIKSDLGAGGNVTQFAKLKYCYPDINNKDDLAKILSDRFKDPLAQLTTIAETTPGNSIIVKLTNSVGVETVDGASLIYGQ